MDKKRTHDFEIRFFEGIVKRTPDYADAVALLAEAYTAQGNYQKGLLCDRHLVKLRPEDPIVHYNLACSYALVGEKDKALKQLDQAMRKGYEDWEHLKKDPDLKSLHHEKKFILMTKRQRPSASFRRKKRKGTA